MKENRLIYLVEDDEWYANLLAIQLEENPNYSIKLFHTGEELLSKWEEKPDLVILDYHLNSSNINAKTGGDILKILNQDYPALPVLMLSGLEDVNEVVELLKVGANDFIVKNDEAFDKLKESVANTLEFKQANLEVENLGQEEKKLTRRVWLTCSLILIIIMGILIL